LLQLVFERPPDRRSEDRRAGLYDRGMIIAVVKKKIIYLMFFCLTILLTACGKAEIRLGTGDSGGMYHAYSTQLSELLTKDFEFRLRSTVGAEANLRLLQTGFLDAALVQSDMLYRAEKTRETAEDQRNYSAVAGLYTEVMQIVVRADSDIKSPEDLEGKRVSLGADESGVRYNAYEVLGALGLGENDLTPFYLSFSESAEALKNGTIDAFFCMAGAPTKVIGELAETSGIRVLSLKEDQVKYLLKMYPYYLECTIPGNTYAGQEKEISTVGVRAVFVVSNGLDQKTVKSLTGEILDHSGTLNEGIVTDGSLSALDASLEVMIPFHRGAAEYLKDHGVEVDADPSSEGGVVFGSQDSEGGAR